MPTKRDRSASRSRKSIATTVDFKKRVPSKSPATTRSRSGRTGSAISSSSKSKNTATKAVVDRSPSPLLTNRRVSRRSTAIGKSTLPTDSLRLLKSRKKTTNGVTSTQHNMEFEEGDVVLSKWPGTALYYKSRVRFVREEDNEYDICFEYNNTVFTLKAREVRKFSEKDAETPTSKRTGRGRSPSRSRGTRSSSRGGSSPSRRISQRSNGITSKSTSSLPQESPTRQSTRVKEMMLNKSKGTVDTNHNPNDIGKWLITRILTCILNEIFLNIDMWITLFFISIRFIFHISMILLCQDGSCMFTSMKDLTNSLLLLSTTTTIKDLIPSIFAVITFTSLVKLLTYSLPVGRRYSSKTSSSRMRANGLMTILIILCIVPIMSFLSRLQSVGKSSNNNISNKIYVQMTRHYLVNLYTFVSSSSLQLSFVVIILSFVSSIFVYIMSCTKSGLKSLTLGQTRVNIREASVSTFAMDLYHGRLMDPSLLGFSFKLHLYRISMSTLAFLNIVHFYMYLYGEEVKGRSTSGGFAPLCLTTLFQIMYVLDGMYYEELYFTRKGLGSGTSSPFLMSNTPYGLSMIFSYLSSPLLITFTLNKFIMSHSMKTLSWPFICSCIALNLFAYLLFRTSELSQINKSSNSSCTKIVAFLEEWIRYPGYLGEILLHWSWVLPAVSSVSCISQGLIVFHLPLLTTLLILFSTIPQSNENKKRHDNKYNIIPFIY